MAWLSVIGRNVNLRRQLSLWVKKDPQSMSDVFQVYYLDAAPALGQEPSMDHILIVHPQG